MALDSCHGVDNISLNISDDRSGVDLEVFHDANNLLLGTGCRVSAGVLEDSPDFVKDVVPVLDGDLSVTSQGIVDVAELGVHLQVAINLSLECSECGTMTGFYLNLNGMRDLIDTVCPCTSLAMSAISSSS